MPTLDSGSVFCISIGWSPRIQFPVRNTGKNSFCGAWVRFFREHGAKCGRATIAERAIIISHSVSQISITYLPGKNTCISKHSFVLFVSSAALFYISVRRAMYGQTSEAYQLNTQKCAVSAINTWTKMGIILPPWTYVLYFRINVWYVWKTTHFPELRGIAIRKMIIIIGTI